ncbi:hypothetical protein CLPU_3c01660 [Gottschalkia purinilytica]|uniref:ATPase n=1 Tax=Gottschalkia purinilytica TaxID=1503 RepID=A0A0L0WD40_GOTPU|nr:ATP-binding protein [Gottschalkia purinilytica]KNF09388.1 hypothetical protein CLPU_3c01660 [Gottschalkia purinilytica]
MAGKSRKMFPGGNTSEGFYSYFNYILGDDANRIFILKGGPGTGKSSIMKKVAEKLLELEYDIEFFHCASDSESIDAIASPELKIAVLDGTAPHVTDPKFPGAIDEIINLGDFWNSEEIVKNKDEIKKVIVRNSKFYKRAYKYLKAARIIQEDIVWKNEEALNVGQLSVEIQSLVDEILGDIDFTEFIGKERHLFGSAYTPSGLVDYSGNLLQHIVDIYYIKGDFGTGRTKLLENVCKEAVKRGLDVEIFHTPLIPEQIETVILKDLNIALTTSTVAQANNKKVIDLDKYLDEDKLKDYKDDIKEDKRIYEQLIKIAISNLNKAKKNHDEIEKYYAPYMDFSKSQKVIDDIISKSLEFKNKEQ